MSQRMPERFPGGGVDLSHLVARGNAPQPTSAPGGLGAPGGPAGPDGMPGGAPSGAPAGGQVVDVPSLVLDVTDDTFEQIAQLSMVVPVVFDLWAEWCQPCKTLSPIIESVTREFEGRLLLAKVDVDANPGLAQAFKAQSIPTVVALIGGRPVPLFQGAVPEPQVREFFTQLVQLAEQNGISGRVNAPASGEPGEAPEVQEPEVPEAHRAAVDAAERGDFEAAVTEWEAVLKKSPADAHARAALVQMRLLQRLQGRTADEIRTAAGADPSGIAAQLAVADLDVSGGHIEDAFLRLLDLFSAKTDDADRAAVRERLLELFEVVGVSDPRVIAARGRLASLLY